MTEDQDWIRQGFRTEVEGYLPRIDRAVAGLEQRRIDPDAVGEAHRAFHIISGAGAMLGIAWIHELAERAERIFEAAPDALVALDPAVIAYLKGVRIELDGFCRNAPSPEKKTVAECLALLDEIPLPEPDERAFRPVSEKKGVPSSTPDDQLAAIFRAEAEEHLASAQSVLASLETGLDAPIPMTGGTHERIQDVRRSIHTIKGAAGISGHPEVAAWAHRMEDFLDWLYEEATLLSMEQVRSLALATDALEGLVTGANRTPPDRKAALESRWQDWMTRPDASDTPPMETAETGSAFPSGLAEPAAPPSSEPEAASPMPEDAFEIRVRVRELDKLVNLAADQTVAISGFGEGIENMQAALDGLATTHSRLRQTIAELDVGYEQKALHSPGKIPVDGDATADFDAIELDRYSRFNMLIRSLEEVAFDIGTELHRIDALFGGFPSFMRRQRRLVTDFHDSLMQARVSPFRDWEGRMRQTVREVSEGLGKKVRFVLEGGETALDFMIWRTLSDPIMHLLRNAVDHGVEPPEVRKQAGKPEYATIRVSATRQGSRVRVRVEDDGSGIDLDALQERLGPLPEADIHEALFQPGFSSKGDVTLFSGRGVGLDVVRTNLVSLKGSARIEWSRRGEGTGFLLDVPVSISIMRVLILEESGRSYAVPMADVREVISLDSHRIVSHPRPAVRSGSGALLPLIDLDAAIHGEEGRGPAEHGIGVHMTGNESAAVFLVDRICGQEDIVARGLGEHLEKVPAIGGATVLGDGRILPILDVEDLFRFYRQHGDDGPPSTAGPSEETANRTPDRELLVVDDSVSVRQALKEMLRPEGWNVIEARDGLEAYEVLMGGKRPGPDPARYRDAPQKRIRISRHEGRRARNTRHSGGHAHLPVVGKIPGKGPLARCEGLLDETVPGRGTAGNPLPDPGSPWRGGGRMKRVLVVTVGRGRVGIDTEMIRTVDPDDTEGGERQNPESRFVLEEMLGCPAGRPDTMQAVGIRTNRGEHTLLVSHIVGHENAASLHPLPALLRNSDAGCLAGVLMVKDRVLPVLDPGSFDTLLARSPAPHPAAPPDRQPDRQPDSPADSPAATPPIQSPACAPIPHPEASPAFLQEPPSAPLDLSLIEDGLEPDSACTEPTGPDSADAPILPDPNEGTAARTPAADPDAMPDLPAEPECVPPPPPHPALPADPEKGKEAGKPSLPERRLDPVPETCSGIGSENRSKNRPETAPEPSHGETVSSDPQAPPLRENPQPVSGIPPVSRDPLRLEEHLTQTLLRILSPETLAPPITETVRNRLQTNSGLRNLIRKWKENAS